MDFEIEPTRFTDRLTVTTKKKMEIKNESNFLSNCDRAMI